MTAKGRGEKARAEHERVADAVAPGEVAQDVAAFYLAAIVESSDDAILGKTLDGTITSWNRAAERLYGYTAAEVIGRPISILVPAERTEELAEIMQTVASGRRADHVDTLRRRKDGTLVHISLTVSPIRNARGELVGASAVARDITRESEVRRRLERSEREMSDFLENAGVPIHSVAPDGTILWANDVELDMLGYDRDEYVGRNVAEFHIDQAVIADVLARLARGEAVQECEATVRCKDGAIKHVLIDANTVLEDGKFVRTRCFTRDVTRQKQAEQQRSELEATLRDADRRKDEFLATLAHELRNPLAPIRNTAELLRLAGDDSEQRKRALDVLERQVRQMVRLIDDLMDASRISCGRIELRKQRLSLTTAIESALETSRPLIEAAGHRLSVDMPAEPLWVDGDTARLAQVFANVLNNAAKYTERGRIWLRVEREGERALVRVRDTGIGIPPAALPHIFEMFTQVDRSLERAQGGLGIGLSLVRALVELHGGTVEAHSEGRGKGSEFVIALPLLHGDSPAARDGTAADAPPLSRHQRRILVVDDNADSADSLAAMLGLLGHDVHTAYDGSEAMAQVETLAPAVVLLDIGLPKLNGYDVAKRIRELARGGELLLIAMTGWGQDEDKHRAAEAGFDLHLTKPLDPLALERALEEHSR